MAGVAARHRDRLRLVALVPPPLCLETGLDPARAADLRTDERRALAACRRVIVTSPATATTLAADFDVPPERLTVAIPGTDPAPLATATGDPPRLLCVGTLTPRKAHRLLLEALATSLDLPWHLVLAGSTDRDPATAAAVRAAIKRLGLAHPVTLAGQGAPPPASIPPPPPPTSWSPPRSTRATAWRWPRAWPVACRSSPLREVRSPTPSRPTPGSSSRPVTRPPSGRLWAAR